MARLDSSKEQLYQPIHNEDLDPVSHVSPASIQPKQCQKSHLCLVAPWIASTISLALILGYIIIQQQVNGSSGCQAASPAFRTDTHDAHPYIFQEERVFTGALSFNETSGQVYRDIDLSQAQYFGSPNHEIDHAWDDLLRGK